MDAWQTSSVRTWKIRGNEAVLAGRRLRDGIDDFDGNLAAGNDLFDRRGNRLCVDWRGAHGFNLHNNDAVGVLMDAITSDARTGGRFKYAVDFGGMDR